MLTLWLWTCLKAWAHCFDTISARRFLWFSARTCLSAVVSSLGCSAGIKMLCRILATCREELMLSPGWVASLSWEHLQSIS